MVVINQEEDRVKPIVYVEVKDFSEPFVVRLVVVLAVFITSCNEEDVEMVQEVVIKEHEKVYDGKNRGI